MPKQEQVAQRLRVDVVRVAARELDLERRGAPQAVALASNTFELSWKPTTDDAVEFWRRTWEGIRLEERYVPLAGLDLYPYDPEKA